ncbi:MAG: hypothetical protein K6G30_08145 [Acetatifactor sp.]|nr:hypothetical protein [Acetatifactor sp.]
MIILEDKAQQDKKHLEKHRCLEELVIETIRVPLPVGDYVLMNEKIHDVIDRKHGRKKVVGKEMVTLKNGKEVERNVYEYGVDLKKMDFVGTYDICVDTKNSIEELLDDIIGKQHERFRDECIFAQNNGIKLYILVENQGGLIKYTKDIFNQTVRSLDQLFAWKNPRLFIMQNSDQIIGYYKNGRPRYKRIQKYPRATRGETLAKACCTMHEKYGVEFRFCTPEESAEKILSILMKQEE